MLYTRKGDRGRTTLFGSDRSFSKSHATIEALGALDELNALLGVCRSHSPAPVSQFIFDMQESLFVAQAEIAGAPGKTIVPDTITQLEERIASFESVLPPITTFFIAGSTTHGAYLDLARTVARRAERRAVAHKEEGGALGDDTLRYLNRLSSALYALARHASHSSGITETPPSY